MGQATPAPESSDGTATLDPAEVHVVQSNDGRTFLVDGFTANQAVQDVDQKLPDSLEAHYAGTLEDPLKQYLDDGIALVALDPEVSGGD
jgi:alpha-ketoglutarate-dependent taurine dioxygenase